MSMTKIITRLLFRPLARDSIGICVRRRQPDPSIHSAGTVLLVIAQIELNILDLCDWPISAIAYSE